MRMLRRVTRVLAPYLGLPLVLAGGPGVAGSRHQDAEPPTVTVEVTRHQPPLLRLEGQPVSVGILLVHSDDTLLEGARSDLWNMSGMVVKAVRDYFKAEGGQVQVVDYTDLGFQMWNTPRSKAWLSRDPRSLVLDPWPGVPLGVKTSLVTVVKVDGWSVGPMNGEGTGEAAGIALLMSTWTREGQPVSTEYIQVKGRTGGAVELRSKAAAVALYEELRKPHRRPLPEEWSEMFWTVLREAVGLHYFRLLPAELPERLELVGMEGEEGVRAFREGRYEDALGEWRRRYEADGKAHGALYDAALAHVMRGEDQEALRLLARAWQVEDRPLYRAEWERVLRRVARTQVVGGPGRVESVTTRGVAGSTEPGRCFFVEREPSEELRWSRGLSVDLEEELLAQYHPEHCDQPGARCTIDFYQVRFFNGIWSERMQPGLNDLDETSNFDGTRRRRWSLFYDHEHRYRYCVN
ncbi:hypothetical protein JRI60_51120 [Archangium violaceum]|uniref:tetratricopeptide repeat protein n=1 Tax=Archangium violaceum TaxID=83451 RepID=UPI00194F2F36|nr:hypothetical protein [Archangium violaceum]QRN97210.1 hypothetical protein JRI60_51120 [Archangium violaceum]